MERGINYQKLIILFSINLIAGFLMSAIPLIKNITPVKMEIPKLDLTAKLKNNPHFKLIGTANAEALINAPAYIVVDLKTGQVLAQKEADKRLPVASLTKIMTAVVALDLGQLDQKMEISSYASQVEPTRMGLVPGQRFTLEELLNALLLTSANDAAQVIQEGIDRQFGPETFINSMNAKAEILGLKNTHFSNSQGYDSTKNYSSAADLATLTGNALSYPKFGEIVAKDYQFYPKTDDHKQADLYNWNGLLGVYPGIKGVKIGNTEDAGTTMVSLAKREGKEVIVVLLGAPGVLERDLWSAKLLDEGFTKFGLKPIKVTEEQLKQKYSTWKYWN